MMMKRPRSLMTWGAIGALAGMMMVPALNSSTRKKVSRTARNAYFRASDFLTDVKDMGTGRR